MALHFVLACLPFAPLGVKPRTWHVQQEFYCRDEHPSPLYLSFDFLFYFETKISPNCQIWTPRSSLASPLVGISCLCYNALLAFVFKVSQFELSLYRNIIYVWTAEIQIPYLFTYYCIMNLKTNVHWSGDISYVFV